MQEEDESVESEMTEGVPSRHGSSREIPEWKPLVREFRPRIISTQALREEARPEPQEAGKPQKKKAKGSADPEATKHNPASLFHQDDEDYVPTVKEEEAKPEIKTDDSGAISKAPLKDDKKHDKKDN